MGEVNEQWQLVPDQQPQYPAPSPPIDFRDWIHIARRRRWSFFIPFVLVVLIAAVVALLLPAVYRSSATILIEEQEIPADFVAATVTSYAEQRLQQINQRIMSTTRLLEIIEKFDLYKKMRQKRTTEEVIEQMRSDVKLRQISAEVVDRRTGRPTTATIAFSLAYQGKDGPSTIQKVANVLVSLFLEENLEVRERQTEETSRFLEDEMHRVQEELAVVDRDLSEFKEKHMNELPELLQLNIQQLGNTERSIERLEEQLKSYKNQEGYLQTQLANISPFLDNSDRNQLRHLETDLATARSNLSDYHPDVIRVKAAIKALKEKVADSGTDLTTDPEEPDNPAYITLASQLTGIQSEILSTKNQLAQLRKSKTRYETRIENTPKVEREYSVMTADQGNLRAKFNDLMQKFMEAKVAHGLEKGQKGERFTLIDPPRLPERPFKPNRKAIAVIGLVLAVGAGFGMASLREFMDGSVYSTDKLALSSGYPILGEVPVLLRPEDVRRARWKKIIIVAAIVAAVIGAILLFHLFVMDLYVFWAKVDRRLGL